MTPPMPRAADSFPRVPDHPGDLTAPTPHTRATQPGPEPSSSGQSLSLLAEAALRRRRRRVLVILGSLTILAVLGFLFVGITGSWEYALTRRVQRVGALIIVGHAIALSTVLFQSVTNNRILSPSIMGFDSLFMLIQTGIVFFFGSSMLALIDERAKFGLEVIVMIVFAVGLFTWLFRGRSDLYVMVLVGIVLGTVFSSLTLLVSRMIDPNEYLTLQDAFFASFNSIDTELLWIATAIIVITSVASVRLFPSLDVVALGRDHAINLGVNHRGVVNRSLVIIAILVSVSTALVGPITFLGLLVANLARQMLGTFRHHWVVPAASLLGVIALVGGQFILEQVFGFNTSLSIIINFVGGVYFIGLLLQEARRA